MPNPPTSTDLPAAAGRVIPRALTHTLAVLAVLALSACGNSSSGTYTPAVGLPNGDATLGDSATFDPDSAAHGDAKTLADGATANPDGSAAQDTGASGPELTGPPCAKSSACTKLKDTPFCQLDAKVCVQCLLDFHCKDTTNHCDKATYTCIEESCVPGTMACQSGFLQVCKADGKGFEVSACPDDKPVCVNSACRKCQPNESYCAKPVLPGQSPKQVMKCDGTGDSAQVVTTCQGEQVCNNGVCGVCTPGAKRCNAQKAEVCATDGSGWMVLDDCPSKGLTCLGGLCVNPCASDFKSGTNVGCDYWAVDLDNALDFAGGKTYDAQNAQFAVIISNTADSPATVHVTRGVDKAAPGAKTKSWTVPAKGLQVINLPDKSWGIANQNQNGSNINNKAYRIQSSQPIVAYQFNPLSNQGVFSNDASLLLPSGSIGKEYWVVSRSQLGTKFRSYFTVVASMPGETKVTVVPSAPTIAGSGVPTMSLGGKQVFTLKQGQVLNVESNKEGADLTGSWVKADKDVVVFGGSEASNSPNIGNCIPNPKSFTGGKVCAGSTNGGGLGKGCTKDSDCPAACCADHLEEQLFPVKAWGKTYVGARLSPRGKEKDAWRILAKDNGTQVTIQPNIGVTVPTLNQGQSFEFETTADFVINASKPVLVAQYMASSYATMTKENPSCTSDASCKSQHGVIAKCETVGFGTKICAPIGDPSLILDVATTQYLKEYIFLVPDKYQLNYLTVIAPIGATVKLDGSTLLTSGFKTVPGSTWGVARLPVGPGKHELTSSKPAGLFVYGYDDDVSYGYPAGAGL